jgi:pimeloyl-ACP methyl ester carboxylesterase
LKFCDILAPSGKPRKIAYIKAEASAGGASRPGVMWLCGFHSHMSGVKSEALAEWAEQRGLGCLRFDYSGCGQSSELFEDCAVGDWLAEAVEVFRTLGSGPQVLVGSSMGAWIALLMARALRTMDPEASQRLKGLALIAPAWDMTEDLMWRPAPEEARRELMERGVHYRAMANDDAPQVITRRLIEEGRSHLISGDPFDPGCPVRILHGMRDASAPWERSLRLANLLECDDLRVTFIKDGEHRLSRPQDLALLFSTLEELCGVGE